jgi:hypothetical protein
MKTLTGLDLLEAFKRLDDCLPPGAYKEITGGKGGKMGLTDINPGYLPPLLLELFGPCGYGWGYNLLSMQTTAATVKRNSGYEEEEYTAICQIEAWYRFTMEDGTTIKSDGIPARGGSVNTQTEWAEKGAITYALGTAWFLAGYQVAVYKGERSHKDFAGGKRTAQSSATTGQTSTAQTPDHERVKASLHSLFGADKKAALDQVEKMTAFQGKDGPVAGVRDFTKLTGKRLEILADKLEKMYADKRAEVPELCELCRQPMTDRGCQNPECSNGPF